MEFEFYAREATLIKEGQVEILSFLDQPDAPHDYLIVQRALHPDARDIRLGHDTYFVELAKDRRAGYGGVEEVRIGAGVIELELSDADDRWGGLTRARIRHAFHGDVWATAIQALRKLFQETDVKMLTL